MSRRNRGDAHSVSDVPGDLCGKCNKSGGNQWIQCDLCDLWYHYNCSGLPVDLLPQIVKVKLLLFKSNMCLQKKSVVLSSSTIQEAIKNALSELLATIDRVVKETIANSVPVSDSIYAAVFATPVVTFIPVSAQADNHWTHELKFDGISEIKGEFNSQTESNIFNLNSILSHLGEKNHVLVK